MRIRRLMVSSRRSTAAAVAGATARIVLLSVALAGMRAAVAQPTEPMDAATGLLPLPAVQYEDQSSTPVVIDAPGPQPLSAAEAEAFQEEIRRAFVMQQYQRVLDLGEQLQNGPGLPQSADFYMAASRMRLKERRDAEEGRSPFRRLSTQRPALEIPESSLETAEPGGDFPAAGEEPAAAGAPDEPAAESGAASAPDAVPPRAILRTQPPGAPSPAEAAEALADAIETATAAESPEGAADATVAGEEPPTVEEAGDGQLIAMLTPTAGPEPATLLPTPAPPAAPLLPPAPAQGRPWQGILITVVVVVSLIFIALVWMVVRRGGEEEELVLEGDGTLTPEEQTGADPITAALAAQRSGSVDALEDQIYPLGETPPDTLAAEASDILPPVESEFEIELEPMRTELPRDEVSAAPEPIDAVSEVEDAFVLPLPRESAIEPAAEEEPHPTEGIEPLILHPDQLPATGSDEEDRIPPDAVISLEDEEVAPDAQREPTARYEQTDLLEVDAGEAAPPSSPTPEAEPPAAEPDAPWPSDDLLEYDADAAEAIAAEDGPEADQTLAGGLLDEGEGEEDEVSAFEVTHTSWQTELEDTQSLGEVIDGEQRPQPGDIFHSDETVEIHLERMPDAPPAADETAFNLERDRETLLPADELVELAPSQAETVAPTPEPAAPPVTAARSEAEELFQQECRKGLEEFRQARWSEAVHHLSIAAALRPEAQEVKEKLRIARRNKKQQEQGV